MSWVIKYFYKDGLVKISPITGDEKRAGWDKHQPPYQPENWDRWEVMPGGCESCG